MRTIITVLTFLISSSMLWAQTIPGFESTYLDASQRAKETGMNKVVFFSEADNRAAAWISDVCLKDGALLAALRKSYVGVVIDSKDFDGRTLMKRWKLTKVPSVALLDREGQLIATANHGMTKDKMMEFLNFYALAGNAGKSMNFSDVSFAKTVNEWQGYKGTDKTTLESTGEDIAMSTPVKNDVQTSARNAETEVEKVVEQPAVKATETTVASSTPATGKYFIQGGVFGSEDNANGLRDKMNAIPGIKAKVERLVNDGKTMYRVIIPGFTTMADAEKVNNLLAGKDIKGIIREQ